jgi:hypothetical protein
MISICIRVVYKQKDILTTHVNNTQFAESSLQQPPSTRVLLSKKIGPEGFSILILKIVCECTMLEEPLQNGPLPLLIEILVTVESVFLNFARSKLQKTLQLPLLN